MTGVAPAPRLDDGVAVAGFRKVAGNPPPAPATVVSWVRSDAETRYSNDQRDPPSRAARAALERADARLHLSAASVWELAIKASLGRLTLPGSCGDYVAEKLAEGFRPLPVDWAHAAAVERLRFHHRDPFDRLLAAQALVEKIPLVTRDRVFRKYGVQVVW